MSQDFDGSPSPQAPCGYYELFEKLTVLMTDMDGFDVPGIMAVLAELCKLLRISKGVTAFYQSPEKEEKGEGEIFVCYDSGEKHRLLSRKRVVTPAYIIAVCDVYQAEDAPPLTPQERTRVETIQRMMLTCLNRGRQEQIINRLTYYDPAGFENVQFWLAEIVRRASQGRLAGMAAIRFNLKHFSLVNEQVGRKNADQVMRDYCRMLRECIGQEGLLARLGGDNFAVLCAVEKLPQVETLLKGAPVTYDYESGQRVEISTVSGICVLDGNEKYGDVMDKISSAYSLAKRSHTNDMVYYSDDMRQARERVIHIRREFESALKSGEFLVYYQPKVDIQTRELIGAEALSRWEHNGRIIPPVEYIPILERGMDICRLDFYMLNRTCRDIRRWLDEGKKVVRVSVNLSRRHMIDPDLFTHIVSIIDANNVPHEYIEIELTETTTDVAFRDLKRIVSQLQQVGIRASVDDFGVGYSSLNLIKEIPWDVLKLDKSILPNESDNEERGNKMFAHVVAMAHEIGLKCVAEGVETEEQLEIMRHYGCRLAQGFLFDKPLPVLEFEKRLDEHSYSHSAER